MGAHPYWYFVNYKPDINQALQQLRQREFHAGRYNPVLPFPFEAPLESPRPAHKSIEEALEAAAEDGTRSILDIEKVSDTPDFCVAAPLNPEVIEDLYNTTEPTKEMVENNMDFLGDIERGHCVYIILYRDGNPDEIFFGGYSFD